MCASRPRWRNARSSPVGKLVPSPAMHHCVDAVSERSTMSCECPWSDHVPSMRASMSRELRVVVGLRKADLLGAVGMKDQHVPRSKRDVEVTRPTEGEPTGAQWLSEDAAQGGGAWLRLHGRDDDIVVTMEQFEMQGVRVCRRQLVDRGDRLVARGVSRRSTARPARPSTCTEAP